MSKPQSTDTIRDTLLAIQVNLRVAQQAPDVATKNRILGEVIAMFETNTVLNSLSTLFDNYNVVPLPYPADADWQMTET